MFKKTAIFYISKTDISSIKANTGLRQLKIGGTYVVSDEVLDMNSFISALVKFTQEIKLENSEVLIGIDEALTFEKILTQNQAKQLDIDLFKSELPFDTQKLSVISVLAAGKCNLIATNKYIYLALISALKQSKNTTISVFPAKYFQITETDLNNANIKLLESKIKQNPLFTLANFKHDDAELIQSNNTPQSKIPPTEPKQLIDAHAVKITNEKTDSKKSSTKQLLIALSLIGIGISAIALYLFKNKLI